MILETERLLLRPFTDADRAPFAAMNTDPEVMRHFPTPLSAAQTDAFMDYMQQGLKTHGFHFLAAELKATNTFIGLIGLAPIDPVFVAELPVKSQKSDQKNVEIGWRLAHAHWGQGLATEGAKACLAYGWSALNLSEIVSFTFRGNAPSRRVMEKIGMHHDPKADFEHPKLPKKHPLRPHAFYRIHNPA